MLLWLWCRPAATAPIRLLAWDPPCAEGAALNRQKTKKEKKKKDVNEKTRNTQEGLKKSIEGVQKLTCVVDGEKAPIFTEGIFLMFTCLVPDIHPDTCQMNDLGYYPA